MAFAIRRPSGTRRYPDRPRRSIANLPNFPQTRQLAAAQATSVAHPPIAPLEQNTAHSNHPVLVRALEVSARRFKGYYDNADFGKSLKALIEGKNHE